MAATTKIERRSGLCVAIDEKDEARALAIARAVRGTADVVKVGYPTVLANGLAIVKRLASESGAPVICDFKIADIPPIAASVAEAALEAGASGVIAHAFVGSDTLRAVAEVAHKHGALAIAVVEMSHEGGKEFTQPAAEAMLKAALAAGMDGIVAPATRPERIKALKAGAGSKLLVFSPGAGAQGGSPEAAARAGADFVIVGRAITQAPDIAAAAKAAAAEIGKGRR
jgi:orotidine-5'-phosphate decarboxylase